MIAQFLFSFSSPIALVIALALALAAAIVIFIRRPSISSGVLSLGGIGMVLLCVACGQPLWNRPSPGEVVVMVDLSPSTRGANYRNRSVLDARIRELVGGQRYRVMAFSGGALLPLPSGENLADIAADRTSFSPPMDAAAILLFSDGRFELPQVKQPVYAAVDPGLESPANGRIKSLEIRGSQALIDAFNAGQPRWLNVAGVAGEPAVRISNGAYLVARPVARDAPRVSVQLSPGDLWPENDQLVAFAPPPPASERWWVGSTATGQEWKRLAATDLPTDAAAYLAPDVIVLENIAASDLSDLQQQRLVQYVRELGGAVVILGGDRAFAAGGYPGSLLETLSPLSSTPPEPLSHWMILADGSGSMATPEGTLTRWQLATDAVRGLIPHLPPDDLIDVGSFAETVTWWSAGKSVRQTAPLSIPPINVFPHGPTNLQDALSDVAQSADGNTPRQLLVVTDADVEISGPAEMAAALRRKNIHVFFLAIGQGSGLSTLQILAGATGGAVVQQFDPAKWAAGIVQLMRAASPKLLVREPIDVQFDESLGSISLSGISPWNRTWPKGSAIVVAKGSSNGQAQTPGARWNVGEGRVAAFAFAASPASIEPVIQLLRRSPRDPRFTVSWETGSHLGVRVGAVDGQHYLNGLNFSLEIGGGLEAGETAVSASVPQAGPGEYELANDSPRVASFATLRLDNRVIDRIAVAGRYPPEFDEVGNDHAALERLAQFSGGQVIAADRHLPLDFHFPVRQSNVTSIVAILGAVFLGLALGRWNWG